MARILIVDDAKSIRVTLRKFLSSAGYEVDVAKDADQAMRLMAKADFDIVVIDIILPRVSGVSLLKVIRAESPQVLVILITGTPTVETASAAVRSGAFDYLTKPIRKEQILKIVANAIRLKELDDERRILAKENQAYQENLEQIVRQRTTALRESEVQLRTLINTLPDLVWLKDPEGTYLSCNPRYERFLGAKEAEILGKTDRDFEEADLATAFHEQDRLTLASGNPLVNEVEVTFADDGHRELLETIKMPMYDSEGELVGVLGIGRDITERKQHEALTQLQARRAETLQELSRSSETLDELAFMQHGLGQRKNLPTAVSPLFISSEATSRRPSNLRPGRTAPITINTIRPKRPVSGRKPCASMNRWFSTITPIISIGTACLGETPN